MRRNDTSLVSVISGGVFFLLVLVTESGECAKLGR
jgi:hypothetical protein